MSEPLKIIDIPNLPDITLPEKIDVTDPGYHRDSTECRINDITVKPGKYHCYAKRFLDAETKLDDNNNICFDGLNGDSRITEITIAHTDIKPEELTNFKPIGEIEVDAGLAGFFPAPFDFPRHYGAWSEFCDKLDRRDKAGSEYESDKEVVNFMHTANYRVYISDPFKNAFFSSSGYGDGAYQLEGIKKDGVYVALRLVFINNDFLFDD